MAAALLRAPTLTRAYWVDEGISVGIASHHLAEMPRLLRLDGSPPLFYALLHFWLRAFGTSEVSVHSLSLLISLAVIPLAWWSARQIFGSRAGRYAAVLATTSPFFAWYSTETRMYLLVSALVLVALTMTVLAVRDRSLPHGVGAGVAFAALMYTHNWGLYLVFATAVVLTVHAISTRDRGQLLVVAGGAVALATVYLPWLPVFLSQARNTAAPWAVSPSLGDLFADPASVLGGGLAVVIGPLFVYGGLSCWSRTTAAHRKPAAILLAIAGLTVTLGWLAAQIEPSWTSRYLAIALAPALIALAGLLASSRPGKQVVICSAALRGVASVWGLLFPAANAKYTKSNVAAVVASVRPVLQPGDLVIVAQSEQLAVVAHYLPAALRFATPLGPVRDPHVVDWRHLTQRLAAADPCDDDCAGIGDAAAGGHVFVVSPFRALGSPGTRWSWAVNGQVRNINNLLMTDPGLQLIGTVSPALSPEPLSPVIGLVFLKGNSSEPHCD